MLRQLHRQLVAVQLHDGAREAAGTFGRPEHLRCRQPTWLGAIAATIRWQHRIEHLRLVFDDDLMIAEDGEQLVGRESRVDRLVAGTRATSDIGNAQLPRSVRRAKISREYDRRRNE